MIVKNLRGFNGSYTISVSGIVKDKTGKRVTPYLGKAGYMLVEITKDGKTLNKRVDKLVARNYVDNPGDKEEVIHLDGDKLNCNSTNLRWANDKEFKAYKVEVKAKAESGGARSRIELEVFDTHLNKTTKYSSPKEAGEALGFTATKIRKAIRKGQKLGNYQFKKM